METSKKIGSRISDTLLLGAAVGTGALLGVLFAPRKGTETREKVMTQAKDFADEVKEKIKDNIGRVKEKVNEMGGVAEEKYNEFKETAKRKTEPYKPNVNKNDIV